MTDRTASLKETCKLTASRWAVWLIRRQDAWDCGVNHSLSKARQKTLQEHLRENGAAAWLAGALSSRRSRSRDLGSAAERLGCQRLYLFPNTESSVCLLVGADSLSREAEGFFRVLALNPPAAAELDPVFDFADLASQVDLGASYSPEGIIDRVLEFLAGQVACEFAYLAIRSGDIFRVHSAWRCPPGVQGLDISLQEDQPLAQMVQSRQGLILESRSALESCMVSRVFERPLAAWMGSPILVGQRIIGQAAFGAFQAGAFDAHDLHQTERLLSRLAYSVENAIVFAEAARYLQRLAMLNELATAASLGLSTDETARRVIQHLRRTFGANWVAIYLFSPDAQVLHEYTIETHHQVAWMTIADVLVGKVIQTGQAARVGETRLAAQNALLPSTASPLLSHPASLSALAVPLKYRGKTIGALSLESLENNAFSLQDEQLLVVIASHLAGLIENIRLNEETRQRTRSLQASVRQLQAARETALDITAALDLETLFQRVVHRARELVDARGAELGLIDEKEPGLRIVVSETPWYNNVGSLISHMAGVAGRVAVCGEPLVVDEYNVWNGRLYPEQVAPFRAVASVPLKFRERLDGKFNVIGVLTVLDDRPEKIFSPEDLQLLELLAPQVAVSIRNARLYQELQERIKAQRLAESRLLRSARLAAVGEMAAGVAHELNNPLTTVSGFVELALEDLPAENALRSDLELVLREAQRARGVVRRMLDFSRPVEDSRVLTNVNDLIRDVLALVSHQIRTYGVETRLELAESTPMLVIDPNQIKQVLLNLIHNALQAMPSGGQLFLRTGLYSREGRDWIATAVADTGIGIPPENIERVFEPFFTTRQVGAGTGLGLAISYTIVTDHGGFIEVESPPQEAALASKFVGKGSRFTVYLPVQSADHDV